MSIGGFISDLFGSTNEDKPQVQKTPYQVDPNAYQYGGHAGGADAAAGAANAQGGVNNAAQGSYENQQNNLYNRGNVGLDQAGSALGMATDARGAQSDALAMARARATGQAPSIAQMQADRQMGQAVAAQSSLAAGARGPAALALAQQNAAGNTANAQSAISGQAQINAAQERLAAEQAYAGQAQGIRATDLGQVGAANQTAGTAFGAGAQSGQLGLGAGGLGLGYAGLANNIQQTQLGAQMNQQAQTSANVGNAQNTAAAVGGQNAQTNQRNTEGLISGVAQGGGNLLGLATGGRAGGGHPYLVGEQGPELIVPKKDGFVFTKPQTDFIMATMTPEQRRALGGNVQGLAQGGCRAAGGPVQGSPWLDSYMATQGAVAPATTGAVDYAAQQRAMQAPAAFDAREAQFQQDAAATPTSNTGYDGTGFINGLNLASGVYGKVGGAPGLDSGTVAGLAAGGAPVKGEAAAKKDEAKKPAKGEEKQKSGFDPFAHAQQIGNVEARGYAAPTYVALPARAMGGPVMGLNRGGLGGVPSLAQPGGTDMLGPGGGLNVMGSLQANSAADTQFLRSPSSTGGYAREDGGPVKGSDAGAAAYEGSKGIAHDYTGVLKALGGAALGYALHSPAAEAIRVVGEPAARAVLAPEPVVAQPAPRAAVVEKTPGLVITTDAKGKPYVVDALSSPTPGSQVAVSPGVGVVTAPAKEVSQRPYTQLASTKPLDEEENARACGGMVLARGGRRAA